jgi:hypothetical protein
VAIREIPETTQERSTQGLALAAAASATWAIGLAAILCDFFQCPEALIIAARTLFAAATCTAIGLALTPKDRAFAAAHPGQMLLLGRLVSRWTYILLYGLALVRIGLYLCEAGAPVSSLDDFQFYIVACVVPLWVIRAGVLARQHSQGKASSS